MCPTVTRGLQAVCQTARRPSAALARAAVDGEKLSVFPDVSPPKIFFLAWACGYSTAEACRSWDAAFCAGVLQDATAARPAAPQQMAAAGVVAVDMMHGGAVILRSHRQ